MVKIFDILYIGASGALVRHVEATFYANISLWNSRNSAEIIFCGYEGGPCDSIAAGDGCG